MQTKALCNVTTINLDASRGQGEQYKWNTGASTGSITVAQPGTFWVDVYLKGCTIRDSFLVVSSSFRPLGNDTTICQRNMPYLLNASVNGADSYKWNDNTTAASQSLTKPGLYWVDINLSGCTFRDTLVVKVDSFKTVTSTARICAGQAYKLPSGKQINISGTYKDTLRNIRGCDSLVTNLTLVVQSITKIVSTASICTGQSYTLPGGKTVSNPGVYNDTIRYASGCDSLIATLTLTVSSVTALTLNPVICQGQTYTLPSGQVVTASGNYVTTISHPGKCDSIITTNLTVKLLTIKSLSPTICQGQSYNMPSGAIINLAGTFKDTIRYATGCDSLITTVNLTIKPVIIVTKSTTICQGQTYTLPSGKVVSTSSTYNDTIRYINGCDSLVSTITLSVKPVVKTTINSVICFGQLYTFPSGKKVTASGTYNDTIRYVTGCDSLVSVINLTVKPLIKQSVANSICEGQSFTLPSGKSVTAAATYADTIRYVTGCDSLISTITLTVKVVKRITANASICIGQTYILPSGKGVTTAAIHIDTLRYIGGCDSLISNITLSVKPLIRTILNAVICQGQTYTFPSGRTGSITGTYSDTIRYQTGCDSLLTTINLKANAVTRISNTAIICEGQTYALPSGRLVALQAVYADTLRFTNGCDSIITNTSLTVKKLNRQSFSTSICTGQTYTLPSGRVVTTARNYLDTVRYISGCDSLISSITLSIKPLIRNTLNPVICQGQSYTFPSGRTGSISGTYSDTIRYQTGCDSLISTFQLTVKPVQLITISPKICAGQNFILPSGKQVKVSGSYFDTLHYNLGCDSMRYTINLTVLDVTRSTIAATICSGQFYTLPSGRRVNVTGTFVDTVHYKFGCDSLISTTIITLKQAVQTNISAIICAGALYTLPSGRMLNSPGIFSDTLRYIGGCDSSITIVNLVVQPVTQTALSANICQGQTYQLPSGKLINTTGNYSDTLHYTTGCDSVITQVNLFVTVPVTRTVNAEICVGETYRLPSGRVVNTAGVYRRGKK